MTKSAAQIAQDQAAIRAGMPDNERVAREALIARQAREAEARTEAKAKKAGRVSGAEALLKKAEREAKKAPTATREDRSVPVTAVSRLFAEEFNRTQIAAGAEVADVDEMADVLESYAVRVVQAEMLAEAKRLTAEAKRLTADKVRVLANVTGSQAALILPAPERDMTRPTGDRASVSSSLRFMPDPAGVIGRALRAPKVAPRALPKAPKTAGQ